MKRFAIVAVMLVLCPEAVMAQRQKQDFVSPDKSCHLVYEGASANGNGVFYDVSSGKKRVIHKGYLRIGPIVNWMSGSIAELLVSEGSPSYHSYYYDCRQKRTSPSYYLPIAFEITTKKVATLEDQEIVFYKLFSDKVHHRAKASGIDLIDYFTCDSQSQFENQEVLRVKMKCSDGRNINLAINVPN